MNTADVEKIVRGAVAKALSENANVTNAHNVTLEAAEKVIKKVFEAAEKMGMSAIAAVVDSGANPVAVMCMDGAFIASYDIALNKAYTSAGLKMSTKVLGELAASGGDLYGIQHTNQGRIVIFGGGEPLMLGGNVIGALGVSGGTLEQDTELAAIGKKYWEDILCR